MMKHVVILAIGSSLLFGVVICPAYAYPPNDWEVYLGIVGGGGLVIGTIPATVMEDSYSAVPIYPDEAAAFLREYMETVPRFPDDSRLYGFAYRTPISPGGSKTWSDIYMWAQNYTPVTPYRTLFYTGTGDYDQRPVGYTGHLALDYVPAECGWDGPMDFWLDLSVSHNFTLPIITTSDPLQGTRFHLTVYAPEVPEPSSLAALTLGLAPLAAAGLRRKRRGWKCCCRDFNRPNHPRTRALANTLSHTSSPSWET